MTRRVVVLTAGLSQPSTTRLLADRLGQAVRAAVGNRGESVELDVVELRELAIELATSVTTGGLPTATVAAVRERVSAADGVIAVTPIIAAGYSGLFKMFFDALDPDALNGMPVLIGATAGTARHSLVLEYAIRPLFIYLRANVATTGVFCATEDLQTAGTEDRVGRAAAEFARLLVTEDAAVRGFMAEDGQRPRRSGNAVGRSAPFTQLLAGHDGTAEQR
ncbi:CE1759 family FMN reductase [Nocardia sp. NPDC050712]|uniref:CE1759 family FMN reductase n=1 Tax=Nocardia sp. NPDC050712 TaxID=3155518 RepID=UPI0033F83D96